MSKTAFITGAGQGIGAAIAVELAKAGFNIAISCSTQQSADSKGQQVVEQCKALGVEAACWAGDVSSFDGCAQMVKDIHQRFGSIDVLVNNAGITQDGLIARMKEDQFDRVVEVNLKGCFNTIRHVTPIMMKQRSGRIINVASVSGIYGNPGQINYAASKAGIIGMTKTAAKELGARGITVNAIAPGFIQTAMTDALPDDLKNQMLGSISLRRFGLPQEVGSLAAFLASDQSAYITGQVIEIDGGLSM